MRKTRKVPKKYFVVDDGQVCSVTEEFFNTLGSRMAALDVGLKCFSAIHSILVDDAINGDDSYIGNMKVTTGLQRTLDKLEERFPCLMRDIQGMERRNEGKRVYVC
jgi:hypothetical protein